MAQFPKIENDISVLAITMVQGYTKYAPLFPNNNKAALQAALSEYTMAHFNVLCARSHAADAKDAKDAALAELVTVMQRQLMQSEVDTSSDQKSLGLIGWGEKATVQAMAKPGMVRDLAATAQPPGSVTLDWKAPALQASGPPRGYLIMRRDKGTGGIFGQWTQVGLALELESVLTGQPTGPELEYRIIAYNIAGLGVPSNTVMVVL